MSDATYVIRNYHPSDFNDYVKLNTEIEKLDPMGRWVSPQVLSENLGRPKYSPEEDLFVVEISGKIVGFINITPEVENERVILDCLVHPEHRRKGLSGKLFAYAASRARELKIKAVRVNIRQDNEVAKKVLTRLGFKSARRFFELKLQLGEVQLSDSTHPAFICRHLQTGEEDRLTRLQNRCFTDAWEYNPNTTEETAYSLRLSYSSPEDVILICEGAKPVGYCWTRINGEADVADNKKKGRICMLGVDPDYRSKGVGKMALLAGLAYLKSKGVQTAELDVDSSNKDAHTLYQSIGFKKWSSTLWYEKAID
ncbi:GNAT family N-acetyltransferase [Chloroflexota bacterium]